jgi:hypothetical protein
MRAIRVLAAHQHRTAAGLFALLVLVYLWPALIPGHVLAPTALLQLETPWAASRSPNALHFINGDLADVPASYYPWSWLARTLIRAGTFPAWNPYAFAGTPLFANVEVAWASPFNLPVWILPLNAGLGVAAALKLWVAAFGMYLLVRELRLSFWPAVLAGAAFALCAFNVVWLSHGVFVSVAALLPWAVWLTERVVRRGRPADGLALTVVVAALLAGGHPGTQIHVLGATALYALVRLVSTPRLQTRARLSRLGLVGVAIGLGALLTAWLLLPGERAAHGTLGALQRAHGSPGFASSQLTFGSLRTALFPDWWGRPSEHVRLGPSLYRERTFYSGAVTLVLALAGVLAPGGWRRKVPFAVVGALGAAIALRTPGLWDLVIHQPLLERIQNGRALLLFVFAVPVLAAFGLQALIDGAVPLRRLACTTGALAAIALAGLASLHVDGNTLSSALRQLVHRSDAVTDPAALALASVGWWLLLMGATAAVVALFVHRPDLRRLAGPLLALLVVLDMLHFAHGFQPMGPASQLIPPRTPAIALLQQHTAEGRIAGIGGSPDDGALTADWSTIYGLHDARGHDAPFPTQRWFRLWRLIGVNSISEYGLQDLSEAGPRVLGLLGVRYIVLPPGAEALRGGLQVAYDGPDARVYANELAVPRAIVPTRVVVARDEDDELATVSDAAFDPRHDAVVRSDESGLAPGIALGGQGSVAVVRERNDEVTLRTRLARDSLVVLDDQWVPGWRVEVDGRPARALQADVVLRGVLVPAGTHEIVWRYHVPGLRAGVALSAAGLLAVLAWAGLLVLQRRRRLRAPRSAA